MRKKSDSAEIDAIKRTGRSRAAPTESATRYDFLPPPGYPVSMTIQETVAFVKGSRSGVYKKIEEKKYRVIRYSPKMVRVLTVSVLDDMARAIAETEQDPSGA